MSLKSFHFVFILASLVLMAFMTTFGVMSYRQSGEVKDVIFAAGSFFGGGFLIVYLSSLKNKWLKNI